VSGLNGVRVLMACGLALFAISMFLSWVVMKLTWL